MKARMKACYRIQHSNRCSADRVSCDLFSEKVNLDAGIALSQEASNSPKDSKTKEKIKAEPADQYQTASSETPAETFVALFRKAAKKPVVGPTQVLT